MGRIWARPLSWAACSSAGTPDGSPVVSHVFRVDDAALAMETSLDPMTATKVLVSQMLPVRTGAADPAGPVG